MAAEIRVHVYLDWTGPGHYDAEQARSCRICDIPTNTRDGAGRPCHQACAENEIARELLGTGQALINDERFPVQNLEVA